MGQYQLTSLTQQDLIKIRHFTLEHWGSNQSIQYLRDLRKSLQLLSEMPLIGKNCPDDLGENVYRFPFGRHVIYYFMPLKQEIVIVAILHQSMVPENHLDKRL